MALKDFHKGVGGNSKALLASENNIQELFYAGKKKSHMWWDKFDIRLNNTFVIVYKDAGRQVHTNKSKLSLLNKNFRADFLNTMKTTIEM